MGMLELHEDREYDKEDIEEISECLYKLKKAVAKIMRYLSEEGGFGERGESSSGGYSGNGSSSGGGYGNRFFEDEYGEEDFGMRRGVRGTGPYSRYRKR